MSYHWSERVVSLPVAAPPLEKDVLMARYRLQSDRMNVDSLGTFPTEDAAWAAFDQLYLVHLEPEDHAEVRSQVEVVKSNPPRRRAVRSDADRLREVAYHEAGHAVAHVFHRHKLQSITIERSDQALGQTTRGAAAVLQLAQQLNEDDDDGRSIERLREEVVVLLAGAAAAARWRNGSRRLTGKAFLRQRHRGAMPDMTKAMSLTCRICDADEDFEPTFQLLANRTVRLVYNPRVWRAIETIAIELLNRPVLSGRRATRIARAVLNAPPAA